ncbi:MAG: pyruvate, phosphate dikinase [Bacilli bacterium]|jgi:pyruvate,orthophosphate dikinase
MAEKKYVYDFDEAYGLGKELLGGKGAGLAEMTHIGVPIPQGFTVTTEACAVYYDSGKKLPDFVVKQVFDAIAVIEKKTGKTFGGKKNPLLVSVRSGARVSMPGMMDTILNLGLNDAAFEALASETSNKRFAADCYRRFILMFTNIAKGHPRTEMDKMLEELKESRGYKLDTEITEAELLELVKEYKAYYKKVFGEDFPSDPKVQLIEAVSAVFRSWDNPRANVYRKMNEIPYSWGTAVNVQSMAFGNKGETSGTGVGFSRNPATGEKGIYAEYLPNAQGEDVVAGIRTPLHIDYLKEKMPAVYDQFMNTVHKLEDHYKDMQDMEFTVEDGKLYFLQTRNGKRTAQAGLKIANDLMDEGKIDEKTAVLRIDPRSLDTLLHPSFDVASLKAAKVLGVGLPASPGAGVGTLAFTAEDAEARHLKGEKVILVRAETSPEDIVGMNSSEAILTMRGGMTSHAAVVARGMGKTCVVGCATAVINEKKQTLTFNGKVYGVNDVLSVNGSTGEIYEGAIKLVPANLDSGDFGRIMKLADKFRKLHVRTNADTPRDAKQARAFGAEGIGLCRTEHMFFDADRVFHMRKMILSEDIKVREAALDAILPHQRDDFHQLYLAMEGEAVNIRLLDPPLHEFLPQDAGQIAELAKAIGVTVEHVNERIEYLHEFNPMMGHRGCRLDVTYPEIGRMQARAIIEAAILASKDLGKPVEPEIMIPLTFGIKEFRFVKQIIVEEAEKVLKEHGVKLNYHVGTMIEIPRAAITATSIAKEAEFFSFGTNDLTQMTFGFSRDDATKFLPDYYANRILEQDPFATIDQEGVGRLVRLATKEGKEGNAELHVGVCGEHGGDPTSVEFFHNSGLDYVSCSPFRVPVARLAAAQAQIKNPR